MMPFMWYFFLVVMAEVHKARRVLTATRAMACVLLNNDEMICWGETEGASITSYESTTYKTLGTGLMVATLCHIKADTTLACHGRDYSNSLSWMPSDADTPGWISAGCGEPCCCASFGGASNPRTTCWGCDSDNPNHVVLKDVAYPDSLYDVIAVGESFACGIKSNLTMECWGAGGYYAQTPDEPFTYVDVGYTHWCAIDITTAIQCGGYYAPGDPPAGTGWVDLGCNRDFCCAVQSAGTVTCWGSYDPRYITEPMQQKEDWVVITVAYGLVCGVDSSDDVYCYSVSTGWNIQDVPDLPAGILNSASPTTVPTMTPTTSPTNIPTDSPTTQPTESPTTQPTTSPTTQPTISPTPQPTLDPTRNPTSPSRSPTFAPSMAPTPSPVSVSVNLLEKPVPRAIIIVCSLLVISCLCCFGYFRLRTKKLNSRFEEQWESSKPTAGHNVQIEHHHSNSVTGVTAGEGDILI